MDFKEAAQLINIIKPKVAVPIHYGSVVGTKQDATKQCTTSDNTLHDQLY